MQDQTPEQVRLTAHQFMVCLLAAVARRGYVAFWAPHSDPAYIVDVTAAAAWQYLQQHDNGEFDYRFCLYTHPIYCYSGDWQEELRACEYSELITLLTPQASRSDRYWYRLEYDRLQSLGTEFPGSKELWDSVAKVFIEEVQKEQPFALAGTPLSW